MKIDKIHCRDHVTDQGDLSDLRLATHRRGNGDCARLERELGLSGVEQSWREEPAADGDVSPALTAERANGLGGRRSGAGCERRHARQPVMRRPLPGSPRDQGIAPDIAATGSCEDQSIEF